MPSFEMPSVAHPTVRDDVPVLVVGGGPCGLLQAYLLAKLSSLYPIVLVYAPYPTSQVTNYWKVRSLVIERYPQRLAAPKAHALSPRSLEICRQFFIDVNHIRAKGSSRNDAFWVNFVTSLNGEHVGKLPYERMDTSVLDETPEMIHNIPQPDFEQILTNELHESDLVEVRKNVSFCSCVENKDGSVYTTVEERESGQTYTIRSNYLIAADGASSYVRDYLKIKSTGEDTPETMMTIHFHADLRPVCGSHIGMLHWVMDPIVSGFIIAYDLSGNQVLICNFDPQKFPVDTWDESRCLAILRAAVGDDVAVKVQSWRPWIFKRKIAEKYRVGNVFLVGDAAHSFPPTGGLGLNSGLADVHNLAYKIAAVLQGWAENSILDTYQAERRHVAEINSQQSVKNGKKIFGLLKALGTTTLDVKQARRNLHVSLRDVEKRKRIDREIEEQQEHFDNLELHIGYVYGLSTIPVHASHYTPKYTEGARLPHAWIKVLIPDLVKGIVPVDTSYISEFSSGEIEARRWSSLDLCRFDSFTLFQTDTPVAQRRTRELHQLIEGTERFGSRTLALDEEYTTMPNGNGNGHVQPLPAPSADHEVLRTVTYGVDFETIPGIVGEVFIQRASLTPSLNGGILVRPDQHIPLMINEKTTASEIYSAIVKHLFGEHT